MPNRLFLKALFGLTLISTFANAFIVPGDLDYLYYPDEKQSVIFDLNSTTQASDYYKSSLHLHNEYEHSFGFNLTQTSFTALSSHQNQITNGFATLYPFLLTAFYSGGAAQMDYFGSASWMDTLALHELAHIYQIDAKHGFSESMQSIFGNNGAPFINPNFLLPTFLIEGNAVMNESRFGLGGRLYVGQHRAMVYALSKEGKLDYTRLLNRHLTFPYTTEKYLIGGYFWAYISKLYGADKANAYFYEHARHFINPLRVNASFEDHFGVDYSDSVETFLKELKSKSSNMQLLEGKALCEATFMGELNHDSSEIYWVQTQERGLNERMSFKNGVLTSEKSSLSEGKLFKRNGKYYSASQQHIDQSHIISGLFDEDAKILKGTENYFYQDSRAGHTIALNIKHSMQTSKLYKNGLFFDDVESNAILDNSANIYHAKSDADLRTVYKNKQALFSFKGYTQKLLEFKDGKLWFIAPTLYGSSLFYYDGQIVRASNADNIVDARVLDDKSFLAVVVTGDNYKVKKAEIVQKLEDPAFYEYDLKQSILKKADVKVPESKAYQPLAELKYASLYPFIGFTPSGAAYDVSVDFADPMGINKLSMRALEFEGTRIESMSYRNDKYPVALSAVLGLVSEDDESRVLGGLSFDTDLIKTAQKVMHASVDVQSNQRLDIGMQVQSELSFLHKEIYGIAYDWHKYYKLSIANKVDSFGVSSSIKASTVNQLFSGLFLKTNGAYFYSDAYTIRFSSDVSLFSQSTDQKIYDTSLGFYSKEGDYLNAEMSLAFKSGIYFDVFPISLRQMSLFSGVSHYDYTFESGSSGFFREYYSGVEFELLGVHLQAFKAKILSSYNTYTEAQSAYLSIGLGF
jgi:hypothetical protein